MVAVSAIHRSCGTPQIRVMSVDQRALGACATEGMLRARGQGRNP